MLSKLRHFVNKDILLSVYCATFNSNLTYLCLVWGQAKYSLNRITLPQKRAIRILHSAAHRDQIQIFKICRSSLIRKLYICQ